MLLGALLLMLRLRFGLSRHQGIELRIELRIELYVKLQVRDALGFESRLFFAKRCACFPVEES